MIIWFIPVRVAFSFLKGTEVPQCLPTGYESNGISSSIMEKEARGG